MSAGFDDAPLRPGRAGEDLLGREYFVDHLVAILEPNNRVEGSTIYALVGPWGSGKTSILNAVKERLRRTTVDVGKSWVITEFNPWFYTDGNELQLSFFRELRSVLTSDDRKETSKRQLRKLNSSVMSYVEAAAPFLDPRIVGAARVANAVTRDGHNPSDAHLRLVKELKNRKQPVLIVLDDLDRLAPDELLLTLKLIRLIGRLPYVHYIVAYDEETLLDVLGRTGLVGGERGHGLEYLEKMIQIRVDVPPARAYNIERWLLDELGAVAQSHHIHLEAEARMRLEQALTKHLFSRLNTPRAVKRYIAQVRAFVAPVAHEVDFVDFVVLTWLRVSEPACYGLIIREKDRLTRSGSSQEYAGLFVDKDDRVEDIERQKFWHDAIRKVVGEEQHEGVATVLSLLFPSFEFDARGEGSAYRSGSRHRYRVANPDYFDRFFAFAVPQDDVSDELIRRAYAQLNQGADRDAIDALERQLRSTPAAVGLATRKLAANFDEQKLHGPEVIRWINSHLPKSRVHQGFMATQDLMLGAAQRIYVQLDDEQATEAINELGQGIDALTFAGDLVSVTGKSRYGNDPEVHKHATELFVERLQRNLEESASPDLFDITDDQWGLLWRWRRADQGKAGKRWLQSLIEEHGWDPLAVASRFVSRRTSTARGVDDRYVLGELDFRTLRTLLDMNTLYAQYSDEIAQAPVFDTEYQSLETSPANRRAVALHDLRTRRLEFTAS